MRLPSLLLVCALLSPLPVAADTLLYSGSDGDLELIPGLAYGNLLTLPMSVDTFSFFVTDIRAESAFIYQTAVVSVFGYKPTVLYTTAPQTLQGDGTTQEIATLLPSRLEVDPIHTALFLIPLSNGWMIDATANNRYTSIVGNSWNIGNGTVDGDLQQDRDVAMRLTTVPEPSTLTLLAVGGWALWRRRIRACQL